MKYVLGVLTIVATGLLVTVFSFSRIGRVQTVVFVSTRTTPRSVTSAAEFTPPAVSR